MGHQDRDHPQAATFAGGPLLVKTATKTTYPTVAGRFYYCQLLRVGGTEAEGATATTTAMTGRFLYAYNHGSAIPPAGTVVIAFPEAGGRWGFLYNG